MPKRKIHNKFVMQDTPFKSVDNKTNRINKWMDEPSQKHPGMAHRKFRHDPIKVARRFSGSDNKQYWENLTIATAHRTADDLEHRTKMFFPRKKRKTL